MSFLEKMFAGWSQWSPVEMTTGSDRPSSASNGIWNRDEREYFEIPPSYPPPPIIRFPSGALFGSGGVSNGKAGFKYIKPTQQFPNGPSPSLFADSVWFRPGSAHAGPRFQAKFRFAVDAPEIVNQFRFPLNPGKAAVQNNQRKAFIRHSTLLDLWSKLLSEKLGPLDKFSPFCDVNLEVDFGDSAHNLL